VWEAGKSFYGAGRAARPAIMPVEKIDEGHRHPDGQNSWRSRIAAAFRKRPHGTAGGLIFYGDGSGAFVAADAKTAKLLWHFNTGQTWKASMTYPSTATSTSESPPENTILALDCASQRENIHAITDRFYIRNCHSRAVRRSPNKGGHPAIRTQGRVPKFWDSSTRMPSSTRSRRFGFLEPVWDPKGFLFVSDEEKNKVSRVYPDGRVETLLETATRWQHLDTQGNFVTTASHLRAISRWIRRQLQGAGRQVRRQEVQQPERHRGWARPVRLLHRSTLDLVKCENKETPFQGLYRLGKDGLVKLLNS